MKQEQIDKMNSLPTEVQNTIKERLEAYHSVTVIYENGKYDVDAGCFLKSSYAKDFKVIGEFKDSDIYTKEQMERFYEILCSYANPY